MGIFDDYCDDEVNTFIEKMMDFDGDGKITGVEKLLVLNELLEFYGDREDEADEKDKPLDDDDEDDDDEYDDDEDDEYDDDEDNEYGYRNDNAYEYGEAPGGKGSRGFVLNISLGRPMVSGDKQPKREDYPNARTYNAAYVLAQKRYDDDDEYEQTKWERCKFIEENADKITAAKYLTHDGSFLYAQAIKDHFTLPCSLPDEDEDREMELLDILVKIAKRSVPLSLEIWAWCAEQFLPYSMHGERAEDELSEKLIDCLYCFPDGYKTSLVRYMADNPDFCRRITTADNRIKYGLPQLIAEAVKEGHHSLAKELFQTGLEKAHGYWKHINELTDNVVGYCRDDEEPKSVEYFRDELLPFVKAIPDGMVQDEIEEWEQYVADYISCIQQKRERYVLAREYSWRDEVADGSEYGLNPHLYDTKQAYLDALNEAKDSRRSSDGGGDDGVKEECEAQGQQREAISAQIREVLRRKQEELKKQQEEQAKMREYANDKNVYTYCGVLLPSSCRPYSYRTEDDTIGLGDTVLVTAGANKNELKGTVVSVGKYLRTGVPYPVEKTAMIIRKCTEEVD